MDAKIHEINMLLENNSQEKAEKLIRTMNTISVRDAEFHLKLVEICENLGIVEKIPFELHLALRDAPDNISVLKKLALFFLDSGNFEKSEKYFRKIISLNPLDKDSYRELWNILEEKKDFEALTILLEEIKRLFPDSELSNMKVNTIDEKKDDADEEEDDEYSSPDDSKLVRFVSLFSGREGVYARQWASPTGETGYTPIKEPFTYNVARNHILGNYTVGIYQLRMDNTVNFIAFDIDITKKLISRIMADKKLWKSAIKNAHTVACKIIDLLSSMDVPVYLEASGYKGRHCWIFLKTPVTAKIARAFASDIVNRLGPLPEGIEIEIFPKQDYVKAGGMGNLIKIPMGIHRKTGRRSQFIDPKTGNLIEEQMDFLEKVEKCPREKLLEITENAVEQIDISTEVEEELLPEEQVVPVIKALPPEYDIETDKEFQYLLLKCCVISSLMDKVKTYNELTNDEIVILSYTIGHLEKGPEAVNYLLKLCPGLGTKYFLKSRLRGNPMSCPKIRSRIPDTTSKLDCNCKFERYPDTYPTPVLHVQDLLNPSLAPGATVDSIQFQVLVQEYLNTKKQLKQLNEKCKNQQKQLDDFFEQGGIDAVQTSFGLLKRITGEEGKVNYLLEM